MYPDGLMIVYSRVNRAWLVLWGIGPACDRIVLRICNSEPEALDYIDELRRPATYAERLKVGA